MKDLQDWCSCHARPRWATGIGMIEAADHVVETALENGNLARRDGKIWVNG